MKKPNILMVALVYLSSFSLYACNGKPEYLMQFTNDVKKIQEKTDELKKEHEDSLTEIMLKSGAHNNCYSCDYTWNKDSDPNLY